MSFFATRDGCDVSGLHLPLLKVHVHVIFVLYKKFRGRSAGLERIEGRGRLWTGNDLCCGFYLVGSETVC